MVKGILHLEGLAVFLASVWAYVTVTNAGWLLFGLLILAPDLSMVGFLSNVRLGAVAYNAVHNYILGVAVVVLGLALSQDLLTALGLILTAHVGIDRFLGYGLKYPTSFRDTHMQRV
jgi:hypothetical protein